MCHPLMGHLPPNHDVGRMLASLQPQNILLHLTECLNINLIVLVAVLLLDGEDFLVLEEDVFVPVLGMPVGEMLCSCPSDLLQIRVRMWHFEQ